MPSRFFCVVILVVWTAVTAALLKRDVLPGLLVGPPPDLRSVLDNSREFTGPALWTILVVDDAESMQYHSAGEVWTETLTTRDGWVNLTSEAWFDSKELLEGTPMATKERERVKLRSVFSIEPSGNLETFRVSVKLGPGNSEELLTIDGRVVGDELKVSARGPAALLSWKRSFPYTPHSLVQNTMGPLEYMPGLHVGQRWTSRYVSPLTGAVDDVSVVVERRRVITWDGNPITTFEVATRSGPLYARTWVRPDGLVLRQEVPFPFVRLLLERQPATEASIETELSKP